MTSLPDQVITTRSLYVRLREATILSGIDLAIGRGEFWGIAGPNGSGKTTLVRAVLGFLPAGPGELEVFGRRIENWPLTGLRRRIGYLPQNLSIDEGFPISAREVILMARAGRRGLFQRLTAEDREVAENCARELGLLPLLDRPLGSLSGGERQLTQLARALAQQPELLILDEPTNNLDPRAAAGFMTTVGRLHRDKGLTVIVITHEIPILPPECAKVALLREGRLAGAGAAGELLTSKTLSGLYGYPVDVEVRAGRHYLFNRTIG
ncbi:MAG: ABC transporter ATP-binding protein [Candidatus Glassbacteria bacterium]